ncbi:MAG: glycosyltransferase family 4 protein [Alphaproteobacteria bacterium]|nr:glycosyltransferase family 4 protein [Alphaproteobacteria bacterium]
MEPSTQPLAGRRVLIVVENLPVPFDRRVWQEANALAAAGAKVSVICPKGQDAQASYELLDGIAIYRHPFPEAGGAWGYLLEYALALFWQFVLAWRVFLTRGFDVLHACNLPDTIFLIGRVFKLFGRRFVFDHHDINPELYEAKFGRRDLFWRLLRRLERATFRTADIAIATNDSYREIAIGRGGLPPEKVFVVRSGPNLARLKPAPAVPAWKRGRRFLIGYVGVIGRQESIEYLLAAMRHIVHTLGRQDIQAALAGDGPDLPRLKALAQAWDLAGYVTFAGRIADRELMCLLSTAEVCVNPDEHNAMNDLSTMNKVLEYMALSKPIVQFALREGRRSAGEASLYARPNDALDLAGKLLELLANPEQRARMGQIGRARIEAELAWSHQAPKLIEAYRCLWPMTP